MTATVIDVAHRGNDRLGECPLWCERTRRLWWVDVLLAALHSLDPATGQAARYEVGGRRLGSIALRRSEGLLLARDDGLFAFDPDLSVARFICDPEPEAKDHRKNDGRVDRRGRFWVGTLNEIDYRPEGALYRVGSPTDIRLVAAEIMIPNSLAFSPDDRTFYLADTRRYAIWAYDFDAESGAISNRRLFAETAAPARPDGSCVDQDGCLWNAEYAGGRVVRYTPRGAVDRVVDLPVSHPTCCCFGGPGLDTLFVTTASAPLDETALVREPLAGSLLAIDAGTRGLPEARTVL